MQQVISELERLRGRSRLMLLVQRSSVVVAWVLVVLLSLILFDFALRLPSAFRLVLLLAGIGAFVYAILGYLRSAIMFSPTLTQLALRVERVLPSVAGRLASSVEFASAGIDQSNSMAARSVRETQSRLAGESVRAVISSGRTWRDLALMLAAVALVIGLGVWNPVAASTGVKRILLPYSDTKWPARTGVESLMHNIVSGKDVHPRGQALPLRAAVTKGEQDQRVDAHYRLSVDGDFLPWQRIVLTHQGGGVHERLVDTNAERIEVYFTTDDDETSVVSIELVPPPSVRRASLTVTPPPYAKGRVPALEAELGQGLDDRAVTDTPSLIGSTAILRFELNKPLPLPDTNAKIKTTFGWGDDQPPTFSMDSSNSTAWSIEWTLTGTQALHLNLVDEHGLANADQIAFRIEAVEDRPPSVTITKPQGDETVLATAIVPVETEAHDDVALASVGVEARVQNGGRNMEEAMAQTAAWEQQETTSEPAATVRGDLDLAPLHLVEGDVVLVSGVASDSYSSGGVEHIPSQSPVRRLRVISDVDFATQLRRQLGAVRQNAIRIEALQSELQDDVIDSGVQPGLDRAQAQLGERIAAQRASVQDIERALQQNKLDDAPLGEILRQTQDLLDFAGRAANKAVESMEKQIDAQRANGGANAQGDKSQAGKSQDGKAQDGKAKDSKPNQGATGKEQSKPSDESDKRVAEDSKKGSETQSGKPQSAQDSKQGEAQSQSGDKNQQGDSSKAQEGQQGQQGQKGQQGKQGEQGARSGKPQGEQPKSPEDVREPAEENKETVEAQQEVRDELTDLIKLLDRDEDTWVVKRQLEGLMKQQAQLEAQTGKLGERTIGQKPEDLPEQQRTELDRIAQKQRDLRDEARKLIDDLRDRSKAMEKIDPQSSESMKTAADTAEQQQLDRDMENAAQKAQQNQMTSAQASQQQASSTMQKMLNDIAEGKRAQAQQLIRQLLSLVESIQRLITVQENELAALAMAKDTKEFTGLDRSMIRLNQNTQSVAGEARTAGQSARRIARSLDRAADTQGAAVIALRNQPPMPEDAEAAENRSLELLKEAKTLAEELQKKTQEEEVQKRREELMEAYRKFAERQVVVRGETLPLTEVEQLDRRQLVEARRLGSSQDEVRTGLNGLRDVTAEIMDSPVFVHVHRSIDAWSVSITEALQGDKVTVDVTDRQQQIADSLGSIMKALEEGMQPPDEFAKDEQNQDGDGGGGQQPLIPPIAQLKLLQGLQEQVYNLTKNIDGRADLDAAQKRSRLRDIGQLQRELMDLGRQMLEALKGGEPEMKPGIEVPTDDAPPAPPVEPEPDPSELQPQL